MRLRRETLGLLAFTVLVLLSYRLRRREIETMARIGGTRSRVAALLVSEVTVVLLAGVLLAGGLTLLTSRFGSALIRHFLTAG